jgi:hypothetical protein
MSEVDKERAARSYWIEVILLAVAAAVSYLVIPLFGQLFFLVPLQALLVRQGIKAFGYGAALFAIAAISFRLMNGWAFELPSQFTGDLLRAEIVELTLLIGGLYVIGSERFRQYRILYRLLGCTVAAGIATAPLMGAFLETFNEIIKWFFTNISESATIALGDQGALDLDAISLVKPIILKSYLFAYFVFLTSQWWIGTKAAARSMKMRPPIGPLTRFHAPDQLIWVLVIGLTLILIDSSKLLDETGLNFLAAAGWNAVLIIAFVFGLQGISIMRVFAARRGFSSVTTGLLIGTMLFISFLQMQWLLLMISALGVSEIWVHYRQRLLTNKPENSDNVE